MLFRARRRLGPVSQGRRSLCGHCGRGPATRPRFRRRMLWIGHGFDPEKDLSYSAYVQEQIAAAGIDNVALVDEIENLESVYSSRRRAPPFFASRSDAECCDRCDVARQAGYMLSTTRLGSPRYLRIHPTYRRMHLTVRKYRRCRTPDPTAAVVAGVRRRRIGRCAGCSRPSTSICQAYVARLFDLAGRSARHAVCRSAATPRLCGMTADFDVDFVSHAG